MPLAKTCTTDFTIHVSWTNKKKTFILVVMVRIIEHKKTLKLCSTYHIQSPSSFIIKRLLRDDIQFNQINSVKLLVKENVQMNSMMMECPNSVLSDDVKLAKQAKQPAQDQCLLIN